MGDLGISDAELNGRARENLGAFHYGSISFARSRGNVEAWATYLADLAGPDWAEAPMTPAQVAREIAINASSVPGINATIGGSEDRPSVTISGPDAEQAAFWHVDPADVRAFTARAFERIGEHAGVRVEARVEGDEVRLSLG
jgi:hypothetical protein